MTLPWLDVGRGPCITVQLQDLEMRSGPDRRIPWISLSRLDGWTDGAPPRSGDGQFETADGGIEPDVHLGGRSIRVEGMIHEACADDLWERMEQVSSVLSSPRWDWLIVEEEHLGLLRQVRVRRSDVPRVTPVTRTVASLTLALQSADWRRVDVDLQSVIIPSSGRALENLGTVPADVMLLMKGPLTNPGIRWGNRAWTYSGSVPSGVTIQVDMSRRSVRNLQTAVHSRRLAQGDWLRLPPGSTTVSRTGTGAGTITAQWRSSWA